MFRGSPGLSADQLAAISAAFGGDDNADTQQAVTQYFFTTPAENLAVALRVEATRMQDLLPDESLWTKSAARSSRKSPRICQTPNMFFTCNSSPRCSRARRTSTTRSAPGPSFDKTTDADLRRFHNAWYAPNNAVLVVVGNVEPHAVLAQVEKTFGAIPAKTLPARPDFNFSPVEPDHAEARYGFALRLDRHHVPFSRHGQSRLRRRANLVRCVEQPARKSLRPRAAGQGACSPNSPTTPCPRPASATPSPVFPPAPTRRISWIKSKQILARKSPTASPPIWWKPPNAAKSSAPNCKKIPCPASPTPGPPAVAIEGRNSPDDDINAIRQVTVADVNRVAKTYLDFDHAITAILTPTPSDKPISSKSYGGGESLDLDQKRQRQTAAVGETRGRAIARPRFRAESVRHQFAQWNQADCAAGIRQRHHQHLWPRQK